MLLSCRSLCIFGATKNVITIGFLLALVFTSCSNQKEDKSRDTYHFSANPLALTAIIFSVPEYHIKSPQTTKLTIRGEIINESRLLVKREHINEWSAKLPKGSIDTTFSISNLGEALSFYVITDSSQLSAPGTKVSADRASEGIANLASTSSDGIGVFEIIVKR